MNYFLFPFCHSPYDVLESDEEGTASEVLAKIIKFLSYFLFDDITVTRGESFSLVHARISEMRLSIDKATIGGTCGPMHECFSSIFGRFEM